ncbi:MAG TPA: hypothetical protein VK196_21925 [Magnetospirillum sp.]|nr:hypothetical protein [Magnetospirillum sp.]
MATGVSLGGTLSGVTAIDTTLYGTKWNTTSLTYSFPTAATDLSDYSAPSAINPASFGALSADQITIFTQALATWSSVCGITLTQAPTASSADMRIYWYTADDNPTARVVDFPSALPEAGDTTYTFDAAASVILKTIWDGGGTDTLSGGAGDDTYVIDNGGDVIRDFTVAQQDKIVIVSANFGNLGNPSTHSLAASQFRAGSGFTTTSQRILYNPATGLLTYDSNGSASGGTIANLATLTTKPVLTATAFYIAAA